MGSSIPHQNRKLSEIRKNVAGLVLRKDIERPEESHLIHHFSFSYLLLRVGTVDWR
jgi:hypothetical protein